jgi:hypothetical protein
MANALYDPARKLFLDGDIDLLTHNIKVSLIDDADYTVDLVNHDFYDDVPGAAEVADSGNLAGKSTTAGVFDATDLTYSSVSGDQFEEIIIRRDTGVDSTSPLIGNIDTATGLPYTPSGADITLGWDDGANKILFLG